MRGRLIQKFLAKIARLDTAAIETAGNYDADFRELLMADSVGDGVGQPARLEHEAITVPVQIAPNTWESLQATDVGNAPNTEIVLYFHFRDLELLSLLDPVSGDALIRVGDRLVEIQDRTGVLIQSIRTPPGLYCIESAPVGWGISLLRPTRNLLKTRWQERSAVP